MRSAPRIRATERRGVRIIGRLRLSAYSLDEHGSILRPGIAVDIDRKAYLGDRPTEFRNRAPRLGLSRVRRRGRQASPWRMANAAAAVRDSRPSLVRMARTWTLTVGRLMNSAAAIS